MPAAKPCTRWTPAITGKCRLAWSFRDQKKMWSRLSPRAANLARHCCRAAGGTSIPGQTCNAAIVMDWSKYMHGVLEINTNERWARVLPGTVCDELRDQAMREEQQPSDLGA